MYYSSLRDRIEALHYYNSVKELWNAEERECITKIYWGILQVYTYIFNWNIL